jgi:hypothetical protein
MSSKYLVSVCQLDQLNRQVWLDMARTGDETELVKSNIKAISPRTLNNVNEPKLKVTEAQLASGGSGSW